MPKCRMKELCAHLGHGIGAGGWAKPNPLFDDGDRSSNESGDDEFVGVEDQDDFHGYAGKNVSLNLLNLFNVYNPASSLAIPTSFSRCLQRGPF